MDFKSKPPDIHRKMDCFSMLQILNLTTFGINEIIYPKSREKNIHNSLVTNRAILTTIENIVISVKSYLKNSCILGTIMFSLDDAIN